MTFAGHSWWVWSAAFSPDESQIATASDDGTVRLWNAATGKEWTMPRRPRPLPGHRGPVYAVAFLRATGAATAVPWMASAGYDKRVLLWKPALIAFDYKRLLADEEVPLRPSSCAATPRRFAT